jgi:hypothetical protein
VQVGEHLGTLEHLVKRYKQLFQRDVGQLRNDFSLRGIGLHNMRIPLEPRQVAEILRRLLETLVFLQSPDQLCPGIIFFLVFGLRAWQQHSGLDLGQHRCHQQIFAGQLELQLFHQLDVLHVLPRDFRDGNIEDIDILTAYEVKQQVEWALECLQKNLQRVGRDVEVLR